ncbi:MAG TPA: DoxX family protein [Dehalococcoidia bacterium]|nr:DoxX family protein [Dehalococcoidia bacterium]
MTRTLSTAHGLAMVRMGFGLYFLATAYDKTTHGWLSNGQPLARFVKPQLGHAEPWYRSFIQGTVLPHAGLLAQLVTIGEWTAGLCLFLGLFTPLGALVAIWLNCNYMLLKGLPNAAGSIDRVFVLSNLVFLVSAAGLAWGLDGVLWRRAPRIARPLEHTVPVRPALR